MGLQAKLGIDVDKLILGISEVRQMSDVSLRQLRYWEKRGYISSLPEKEGASRQYSLKTTIQIMRIKHFLDEGYTLATAVAKVTEFGERHELIHQFLSQRLEDIIELDGEMAIDFGDFDADQRIYCVFHNGQAEFKLKSK